MGNFCSLFYIYKPKNPKKTTTFVITPTYDPYISNAQNISYTINTNSNIKSAIVIEP